jgi:GH24 family phage-related lysozyme (muramidase)
MQTFGEAKQQLQQRQAPIDLLSAPYEGLQQVAKGVSEIGSVTGQIADKAAQLRVQRQVMEGQDAIGKAYSDYQAEVAKQPGLDPNQITQGWKDRLPDVISSTVSNPDLSPLAKQQLSMYANHFGVKTTDELNLTAASKEAELAKQTFFNRVNDQTDAGDIAGAHATLDQMKAQHIDHPEVIDEYAKHIDQKHELNQWERGIDADPMAVQQQLAGLVDDKGQVQGSKLSLPQLEKLQDEATRATYTERGRRRDQIVQMAENNLLNGGREQIETLAGGYLSHTDEDIIMAKMGKTQPPDPEQWANTLYKANNYDASKDPDGAKLYAITGDIHALPEGWKDPIRKALEHSESPDTTIKQTLSSRIQQLTSMGTFGDVTKKNGQPVDPAAAGKAWEAASAIQYDLSQWTKENPKSSLKDAEQWLNDKVKQATPPPAPDVYHDNTWHLLHPTTWGAHPDAVSLSPRYDQITASPTAKAGVSDALVEQVKEREGFNANAFHDGTQNSVGYGTRAKSIGEVIDEPQADARLRQELSTSAQSVDAAAKQGGWNLTQAQRDALVSFDFNTGAGASVLSRSKGIADLQARMSQYTKQAQGGQMVELPGLVNRRKAELAAFNQ